MNDPVFYSFRRCPYAIRARLALASSGLRVALREVLLRDKAAAFLEASPSATVPCLVTPEVVIDESLDIMLWALAKSDPEALLDMPAHGHDLIAHCDGPFKTALDLYKYHSRRPDSDRTVPRDEAASFLHLLDTQLADNDWLFGGAPRLADLAILPFVRQFAFVDKAWFDAQEWPALWGWLERFITSPRFHNVFQRFAVWQPGDAVVVFPCAHASNAPSSGTERH